MAFLCGKTVEDLCRIKQVWTYFIKHPLTFSYHVDVYVHH